MSEPLKNKDWFRDDRIGLHCTFCEIDVSFGVPLYNHKTIKHIVCATCLSKLFSIQKIKEAYNVEWLKKEIVKHNRIGTFQKVLPLRRNIILMKLIDLAFSDVIKEKDDE